MRGGWETSPRMLFNITKCVILQLRNSMVHWYNKVYHKDIFGFMGVTSGSDYSDSSSSDESDICHFLC